MCFRVRCCILLALALFVSRAALAQSVYGSIRGALTLRTTGQPVPHAVVLVSSLEQGDLLKFSGQTDDSGHFTFENLPLGAYQVSMKKEGFKTWVEPDVPVSADNASEINVKLAQGDPAQKDMGDGSAISILKLDRADVATSFSRHEIESLPIYLQNVSLYELLVPGAVRTRNLLVPQQNPQGGVYTSLSGQHYSGTSVMVDGTVDRDPLEGLVVLNPSLDSVSELKITTQNYSAEFGPATGGVVSIQTRSGTNQLHGSAFGFRLSGFGQASTPNFNQSSFLQGTSEKRNDFGAALGGAPIRDRLFLFGDYRGIRSAADATVLLTVPTARIHNTCTGNPGDPACDMTAYVTAGAPCNAPCAYDSSDLQYEIPNSTVSPQMVNFLNMIPMPKGPSSGALTNNFLASGGNPYDGDTFDIRADYVMSSKMSMFTRYTVADYRENGTPAFGAAVGGLGADPSEFAGTMKDLNQGISTGFSLKVSSSLLTDLRFGFFRYNLRLNSLDSGAQPATAAGVGGLNLGNSYTSGMPDIQLDNPGLAGLPIAGNLDLTRIGYSRVANGCNCPLREREQQFQFVNNWTKLLGKHDLRWGADFRYLQNYRLSSNSRPAGHLEFGNSITGFSLGDFLIGALESFDRSSANPGNPAALNAGERQNRLFVYGEDTWRINSRLIVNYGLRWEIYLPQSVTGSGAGGWLELGSGATPVQDQFLVAGEAGSNLQGNVRTTLHNFGPRLGLAYLVNPKTVIRAGYGRMFDPGYAGTIFGIVATQSPPVSLITTIGNGFTINSNANPATVAPIDICSQQPYPPPTGSCTVPAFVFPTGSFTINDLYTQNKLTSPNPLLSGVQSANLYALPRRLRLPTVDGWNVAVQEALDRHTYLEISYVANKGTHVLNDSTGGGSQVPYYNLNQPTLVNFIAQTQLVGVTNCQGPKLVVQNNVFCKTAVATRTPFSPWTSQVNFFGANASANYNSMQVKVRRQFSSGFSLLANYTWSKIIDFDNLYYAIDPSVSRGVGNFDRKHNFVMTNIWDLPVGRGQKLLGDAGPVLNRVAGGWSLAAITSWSSGLPFTPTYRGGECTNDIGANPFDACRPNLVGAVHITGSRDQYFTTTGGTPLQAACAPTSGCPGYEQGFNTQTGAILPGATIGPWQRPGAGQIGDAGRNSLRSPGFFQSDLAVAKGILLTERVILQFRADAFNVFNRVNLGNPNAAVDGASGGQITSLSNGAIQRQMQFSLRVNF
jgi:Carboxypeptidase regulatory-like domain/TonB dependent receptor